MQLTKHFTLREFTRSQTALRRGIANDPPPDAVVAITYLCQRILEPVREHFGRPVRISSGFRSLELNRAIGSKDTSQHIATGDFCAADWEIPGIPNPTAAAWVSHHLEFDQLIGEFWIPGKPASGWIHTSVRTDGLNRRQILRIGPSGVESGLSG